VIITSEHVGSEHFSTWS